MSSEKLEKEILHHRKLYFRGRAEISNEDYDQLEEKLRSIDPENPILQAVGMAPVPSKKIRHAQKMLSLEKTYDQEKILQWAQKIGTVLGMLKLDGVSCSLVYSHGRLHLAKTRGDGTFGEDIKNKALWIDDIPKTLKSPSPPKGLEVRGEIFCRESSFIRLAWEMAECGLERPNSQRNIVAGLLGRKDFFDLCRHLSFWSFDLLGHEGLKDEDEKFRILSAYGLPVVDHQKITHGPQVRAFLKKTSTALTSGEVPVDGAVFVCNDLALQKQLGATAHHPRYKLSFKFKGETAPSTIESIQWAISRNGVLTPVAQISPVSLSGATISRVTLHNYGIVMAHQLKKGDRIEIVRSGEVIPKFLCKIKNGPGKMSLPTRCPSCQTPVAIENIRLLCPNPSCPGRQKESLLHFVQKIGIEDLSSKRLHQLIDAQLVSSPADLYKISKDDLLGLEKFQEALAEKLYQNIQASKSATLPTFLWAMGLDGGGYHKCEKIVLQGFNTLEKIKRLTAEQLIKLDSFGEKSASSFIQSLKEKIPLIEQLQKQGFRLKKISPPKGPYQGKRICITGALSVKRSEIERIIKESGAIVANSVSKNTDFLLTNQKDGQSSKFLKAQELGIPIIDEKAFQRGRSSVG